MKTHKVKVKGKQAVIKQKQQKQKWQPHDNPSGMGSSLAFAKPVANASESEPVATIEQTAKKHPT